MKIQESAENYLEAILVLTQKNGQVRSIDVAHYTGFSKPSISRAVGLLRDNGYVSIDQNGLLGLTESGMQIATSIYERHTVLTAFLTALGVDAETAAEARSTLVKRSRTAFPHRPLSTALQMLTRSSASSMMRQLPTSPAILHGRARCCPATSRPSSPSSGRTFPLQKCRTRPPMKHSAGI